MTPTTASTATSTTITATRSQALPLNLSTPQPLLGTDSYDSENRLTQRTGTNGSTVRLVYDGDGNRVCEIVGGQIKSYLIEDRNPTGNAQVVEEIVNGVVNHTCTYGHDLISQDQIDAATNTWHATFYAYDGHGNVRFLTNETGAVTDTYVYDAFGTLITATGSTNNRYLYTGEQFDPNLGLYYLRARLMNPLTGRFWTQDYYEGQTNDSASLHKYVYSNADPTNRVDPSGNFSLSEINVSSAIQTSLKSLSAQGVRFAYARAFNAATQLAFSRTFQAVVWGAATAYEAYHLTGDPETAFLAGALGYAFSGGPILPRSWTPGRLRTQVISEIRGAIDTRGIRTLDPDAVVGIRGSTATGVRFKTVAHGTRTTLTSMPSSSATRSLPPFRRTFGLGTRDSRVRVLAANCKDWLKKRKVSSRKARVLRLDSGLIARLHSGYSHQRNGLINKLPANNRLFCHSHRDRP
jgi:RHS repeat-associated protein